ncbi:APC family permease [Marinomonas gallaica]|uniref:APC family permease n=1 Tax=Marinomonas gallaica TaxID=1806667 RepID=UPI003CE52B51
MSNHNEPSTSHLTSRKKLGFISMMGICIGLVIAQGGMISGLQGIGIGGTTFVAALFAAFLIAQFNAMSFAELSLMFPEQGTLATYTQKAIGHFPAIVAVFSGYVIVATLAVPVELFLVDAMLSQLFPGGYIEKSAPLIILLILTVTNLVGADVFSKVQNLLAFALISALVILGLAAVTGASEPHPVLTGSPVDWGMGGVMDGSFIGLIALAMWLMVGVEFICPMVNEVKNPEKNIPRAMHWSLVLILVVFLLFIYGASLYMNTEALTTSPIPYLDYAQAVFGNSGLLIATIIGLTAACSSVNTLLAAIPRMLHGMAMQKQVFPQLKAENRYNTPWVGIIMLAVFMAIPYLVFSIDYLIILVIAATTSWLLAYIVTHINVMVLRRRYPNFVRPYKTPFYPLPQIIGIIAMVYVALNNSPSPDMINTVFSITGSMLLVVSIIAALWVKLYMKRGLFTPDMD